MMRSRSKSTNLPQNPLYWYHGLRPRRDLAARRSHIGQAFRRKFASRAPALPLWCLPAGNRSHGAVRNEMNKKIEETASSIVTSQPIGATVQIILALTLLGAV